MALKLLKIHNAGDPGKEQVMLRADADCQLNDFLICDNTYTDDGTISNTHCHTYHFPKKDVKKGDYVVLFTKAGTANVGTIQTGNASAGTLKDWPLHRFYWGMGSTVWNEGGDCAHLFQVKLLGNARTE